MSVKHTTGEWGRSSTGVFIRSGTTVIAKILDGWTGVGEADANAKLICAAPQLLNAVKQFVGDFETDYVMSDGTIVDKPSNILLENYIMCKKALEKATIL